MEGLKIARIEPDSRGAKMGFKAADRILRFEGEAVETFRDFYMAIFSAGGEGTAVVLREGKEMEVQVRFDRRRRR